MNEIKIGRLLRASTAQFVVGCQVRQLESPGFGNLVRVPVGGGLHIFGLISDMRIEDDGLVRQLVTTEGIDEAVIADNRINRNVPVELTVLVTGYRQNGEIRHLLPPRPALSLDMIYLCGAHELAEFTQAGRFGYFRHLLRAEDVAVAELLAAHITQVAETVGDREWVSRAARELISLLRDDHDTLMAVLGALSDAVPQLDAQE
jgi:hypothetical protein